MYTLAYSMPLTQKILNAVTQIFVNISDTEFYPNRAKNVEYGGNILFIIIIKVWLTTDTAGEFKFCPL
jgi:hypothetical protein